MGNAAIAGIEHENAVSAQHQTRSTSSPLAADNPNSQVNPVTAYLSGPYANPGDDAEMLAGYNPFNGPLLASADGYSTYTGVYGLQGEANGGSGDDGSSDHLTLSGESENDKEMDQLYSLVEQERDLGAPPIGIANPSPTDLLNYLEEYAHLGSSPAGATTLATITVTPSADELAQPSADTGWANTLDPTVGTFQGDVGLQFNPAPIDWSALGEAGGVKDVAEGFSFGLGMGEIANKGAAQIGALNILNRANALQRGRMDLIGKAATFEDLDGVVSDLSKSGQWIGKFAPAAKYLGVAGVVTDAVVAATDVYNAPTLNQKAMVAAQDTTSFAGELAAAEGGAMGLSALVDPVSEFAGPYAPFVIAGAGILGGIGGLAAYNFTPIKNETKAGVARLVTGIDDVIENPHIIVDTAKSDWNQFKSDAQATAAYLEYLSVPGPKGPYQP